MCSENRQFKRAPVSVHILLFICTLYSVFQALMLFGIFLLSIFDVDSFVYSIISGTLSETPWVLMLGTGLFGLWKRKAWGWSIWLTTSLWFIFAGMPTIDIKLFSVPPRFDAVAYLVFLLLLAPGVRKWCKVKFFIVLPPIFAVLAFYLGWIWCSVILHQHSLPPDIAEINSLMVVCSIICWLFYWVAAYSIAKGKKYGVILSVLATVLSIATMAVSLLCDWFGLQQRVLWSFSTIQGKAGLWISVNDSLLLLGLILIAVNLIMVIMLVVFRKKVLNKYDLPIENIKPQEAKELVIKEKEVHVKLALCVALLVSSVPVLLIGWIFFSSAFDLHSTVVTTEALEKSLQFSTDGKTVAYLWRNATYKNSWTPGARPLTMTDALEVRWFPVDSPQNEKSVPLDSIDFRPDGQTYYWLDGDLSFSPDSKNIAAVCAKHIIIIDAETVNINKLHYEGEWFDSLRWLSEQEITFSTKNNKEWVFWRLNINEDLENRVKIYREDADYDYTNKNIPPRLRRLHYSPNGKFVFFHSRENNESVLRLLNLETGNMEVFDVSPFSYSWKPDGTEVLINEYHHIDGHLNRSKLYLIKTKTMEITELTEQFHENIGKHIDTLHVNLHSSLWTHDNYIVFNIEEDIPNQGNPNTDKHTGYIAQLDPFKIIFSSRRHRFIQSPLPGWIFILKEYTLHWADYAGNNKVKMNEWVYSLVWSPDASYAAKIKDGKVVIVKPALPASIAK